MSELTSCINSADELVVVGFALPCNMSARVLQPAKWTCVHGSVFVSESMFVIEELTVYEFGIVMPSLW
jgi:hypothetical protein